MGSGEGTAKRRYDTSKTGRNLKFKCWKDGEYVAFELGGQRAYRTKTSDARNSKFPWKRAVTFLRWIYGGVALPKFRHRYSRRLRMKSVYDIPCTPSLCPPPFFLSSVQFFRLGTQWKENKLERKKETKMGRPCSRTFVKLKLNSR